MKKPLETLQPDAIVARLNELDGEKVNKMPAPSSTTLSDEEISMIMNGVFIEGNFLGLTNPVFMPLSESGANYRGMYLVGEKIGAFTINKTTKVITLTATTTLRIDLNSIGAINGKNLASYPANDVDKYLSCKQGTLGWTDINLKDIVDDQGNKRFVEGDITLQTTAEGIALDYGKWSLSGTHLMIVVSLSLTNGSVIPYVSILSKVGVPEWVLDKIVVLGDNAIEFGKFNAFASDNTTQEIQVQLRKNNANGLFLSMSNVTLTADRKMRVAFDLLIDNEAPEDNS